MTNDKIMKLSNYVTYSKLMHDENWTQMKDNKSTWNTANNALNETNDVFEHQSSSNIIH